MQMAGQYFVLIQLLQLKVDRDEDWKYKNAHRTIIRGYVKGESLYEQNLQMKRERTV